MKQILTVKKKISSVTLLCEDSIGRTFQIHSDRALSIGQTVLVVNGIVAGRVRKSTPEVYEV